MHELVQIRLGENGPTYYYHTSGIPLKVADYCIVEHDRGLDCGQVVCEPETIVDDKFAQFLKNKSENESIQPGKIVRLATPHDLKQVEENKHKAMSAFETCIKKIQEHKLDMKLVDTEYSYDRTKIIFYFTADGRVDFRELVKDLARIFKARIELKQIGVRDEAKLFGGFGPCGRELCCARFLKDFEAVTIKMAKEQGLSSNPPKISGICGRLMCCLGYEYNTYRDLSSCLPKEGSIVNTKEGRGKVISVNTLKCSIIVEVGEDKKHIEVFCHPKQK